MKWMLVPLLLASFALAANPQDEQVVRNSYAKLAYAVQSKTVYVESQKNPNIPTPELTKKLQANELRFDITEMSSGRLEDIANRPYSDFVSKPDTQEVLQITHDEETFDENGKRATTYFLCGSSLVGRARIRRRLGHTSPTDSRAFW